jgi:O-antigen/teichoic acid export membrane protein
LALKLNIAVNYLSQLYNGMIGIMVMPFYLKFMGAESYGLIAFFMLLQTWFYLLDIGLSQTLSRETVRFKNGLLAALSYFKLYRSISLIFLSLALGLVLLLSCANAWIAQHWLKVLQLPMSDVLLCLQLMFVGAGLRCMGGIYRGVIQGFEKIVWMSIFNITINTLRFVVVIPLLYVFDFQIKIYFYFQLLVAGLEFGVLFAYQRYLLARHPASPTAVAESSAYYHSMRQFALLSGSNFILWLGISQSDKLLMSALLSLADYAYYSIAILLASVIYLLSTPMSNVLLPRMTALYAQHKIAELEQLYQQFAQGIAVLVASIACTVFFNAKQVLLLWSNDPHTAAQVAGILKYYIVGNVFLALNAFSYYIQYAYGDVKRHFYGNLALLALMLPSIYWAALHYQAQGAAVVWLLVHGFWFMSWTLYVNRHFIHQYWQWSGYLIWIMLICFASGALLAGLYQVWDIEAYGRSWQVLALGVFAVLVLLVTAWAAPCIRQFMLKKIGRLTWL